MWLEAALWGWVSGSALLIGAGLGYFPRLPQHWIATIMAFGSGVLMAALSFDLLEEAYDSGGSLSTSMGFFGGALMYTIPNWYLAQQGAQTRKQSGDQQPSEESRPGSGSALAMGALLDGIPESIVIGLSLLHGHHVSKVAVIAIFLSNIPEGLTSAAGMRHAGRSAVYTFGVWGGIAFVLGVAAVAGNVLFSSASPEIIAATLALGAGAILAMVVNTMLPEAFEHTQHFSGLIAVSGFLLAFLLSKLGL